MKVKKHFAHLETQDKENNGEEPIRSKYSKESLNSDLSEHCQQFNQYEFLCNSLTNEDESINSNCTNNEADSSCSSIEYYLFENDFNEERSNGNNTAEFSISFSNSFNVLKDFTEDTNSNLASNLAQWALEYRISHTALNSLLCTLQKFNLIAFSDARTLLKTPRNSFVFDIYDGKYCYFGIANSLQNFVFKSIFTEIVTRNKLVC